MHGSYRNIIFKVLVSIGWDCWDLMVLTSVLSYNNTKEILPSS